MIGTIEAPTDGPVSSPAALALSRNRVQLAFTLATRSGSLRRMRSASSAAAAFGGVMPTE